MKGLVREFDRFLSRLQGIYIFDNDPLCLFRLRLSHAKREVLIKGVKIPIGAPLLEFHLWNERAPVIPKDGAGLEYGVKVRRMMLYSLGSIARDISADPNLASIQALVGVTSLVNIDVASGGLKLFHRFGFSILPYQSTLGKFSEFWENLYGWTLIWAYNDSSLKYHPFSQMHRSEIWMLVGDLIQKYGDPKIEQEGARV